MSSNAGAAAIVGLGMTEMGRVFGPSTTDFAVEAVTSAVADAGLTRADVDGLLVSPGLTKGFGPELARTLGLHDLATLGEINTFGASAAMSISTAAMHIASGTAEVVVCVFADAPIQPDARSGASYAAPRSHRGFGGLLAATGFNGATTQYALAAKIHMDTFGTTSEQLAAIAVAQRAWAAGNPAAQMREPITIDDHQRSRWIVDPLHLLDCCLVSNGGVAVVVTSADRARDLPQPPVHVWGWGQGHPGQLLERGSEFGLATGAASSGPRAMRMAGITPADVDVCELYDCYTFTVLVTLEDYGFCAKGEGGAFAASGALGPGGTLPTNTGGGQLSGYYMWGFTPLSEAVIQVRGQGGARQAPNHDVVLMSGNGGILDYHSSLVLAGSARNG